MRLTEHTLPILALFAVPALALQAPHSHPSAQRAWCANVILPQARAFHVDVAAPAVRVAGVRADIVIVDGVATTRPGAPCFVRRVRAYSKSRPRIVIVT